MSHMMLCQTSLRMGTRALCSTYSTTVALAQGPCKPWSNIRSASLIIEPSSSHTAYKQPMNHIFNVDIRESSSSNGPSEEKPERNKLRSVIELMRWDKPTGTILTLVPALWSISLVTPDSSYYPDLTTMAIFSAGALVARGMGCTVNDLLDKDFDGRVERTRMRPIACGAITPKEAFSLLIVQSFVGLGILCLNNMEVIKIGFLGAGMMAAYPLFKRFTNWPQAMLALTFNLGVPMGYAAIKGAIHLNDLAILSPLYLGAIFWTMYYDTIYAHQDKKDDAIVGIKSSALRLGDKTKRFLHLMSAGMFSSLATAGFMTDQLAPYYVSVLLVFMAHQRQIWQLDLGDSHSCWRAFDSQKYLGACILFGILYSVMLKGKKEHPKTDKDVT